VPDLDAVVRRHILRELITSGAAPSVRDTARALGDSEVEVGDAYERLAASRVIVLRPGTRDVLMAAPLSAVPTPHIVRLADGRSRYGNCIWDALGVLAMMASDGDVETLCHDCGAPLQLSVRDGALAPSDAVVHFAVPAVRWWEDIVFT
jgi:alkylmercury lyase